MPAWTRSFLVRLGAIAAFGLALRVAYVLALARKIGGSGDYFFYHWTANLLAEGRGFVDPFRFLQAALAAGGQTPDLDAVEGGEPSAGHPPLWPLVLSIASRAGATGEVSHKLVGCLLGAAAIVAIGLLGRRLGGERVGLIAAALAAVYPVLIAADGSLLSETLYGLLIALTLIAAHAFAERPVLGRAAALGALTALAALTRSEALLLIPLLALPLVLRAGQGGRRSVLLLAACCLAAVAVLAPWTIRNWSAFDRPVLISTNDGTLLAGANCPDTYSGRDMGAWSFDCISTPRPTANEAERSARWRREGLEYARDHASRLPAVLPARLLRTWDLYQPLDQVRFAEARHRGLVRVGIAWYFLMLPLAVAGFLALRRRVPVAILLAPVALVIVTSLLGYGVPRLRHAAEIPLVVMAAAGVERLLARRGR